MVDRDATSLEFFGKLTPDANTEHIAAIRRDIESSSHFGGQSSGVKRQEDDRAEEFEPLGGSGRHGQRNKRVGDRRVKHDVLTTAEDVEPQVFYMLGKFGNATGTAQGRSKGDVSHRFSFCLCIVYLVVGDAMPLVIMPQKKVVSTNRR